MEWGLVTSLFSLKRCVYTIMRAPRTWDRIHRIRIYVVFYSEVVWPFWSGRHLRGTVISVLADIHSLILRHLLVVGGVRGMVWECGKNEISPVWVDDQHFIRQKEIKLVIFFTWASSLLTWSQTRGRLACLLHFHFLKLATTSYKYRFV